MECGNARMERNIFDGGIRIHVRRRAGGGGDRDFNGKEDFARGGHTVTPATF
jgi:hypothetical protein